MILIAPEFFKKVFGYTLGSVICIICGLLPLVIYVLGYRFLAAYAPFEIDLVVYVVAVMIFHVGLVTYLSLRKIGN